MTDDDLDALANAAGNGPTQPSEWYGSQGYATRGYAPSPAPTPMPPPPTEWRANDAFLWGFFAGLGAIVAWGGVAAAAWAILRMGQ